MTATDEESWLGLEADAELGLDNPYRDETDPEQEDFTGLFGINSLVTVPVVAKTTAEAAAFLMASHKGPLDWKLLCLKLQRMARGLPAVYPSALAAANATPVGDRVTRIKDLRRGMVAFSDDPYDSNPFGHVYFIAGRDSEGRILTWTNDALRSGGVDIVPLDFFAERWGDKFQFGAVSLNGYDFSDLDAKPEPKHASLGDNYNEAVERVEKSIRYHKDAGHPLVVKLLSKDLKVMKKRQERFS